MTIRALYSAISGRENQQRVGYEPLGNEDEVGKPVNNHSPHALFDYIGKNAQCRRRAGVTTREDIHIRALCPVDVGRRVNGCLDVGAIEIQRRQLNVLERAAVTPLVEFYLRNWQNLRESENIPQDREGVEDAIDVEGRVLVRQKWVKKMLNEI